MTTLRMGSKSTSIAISMDTWQRNASQRRKKTSNDALNVTYSQELQRNAVNEEMQSSREV